MSLFHTLAPLATQLTASQRDEALGKMVGDVFVVTGIIVGMVLWKVESKKTARRIAIWVVVVIGLLTAGFLAFTIPAISKARKEEAAASLPKQVSSKDGSVSITVPGNWEPMTRPINNSIISLYGPGGGGFAVIPIPREGGPSSLEDCSDLMSAGLAAKLADAKPGLTEHLKIGGLPAIRLRVTATVEGNQEFYILTLIETTNFYYYAYGWADQSVENEAAPAIKAAADSFKAESPAAGSGAAQ